MPGTSSSPILLGATVYRLPDGLVVHAKVDDGTSVRVISLVIDGSNPAPLNPKVLISALNNFLKVEKEGLK